ncbi:hypothetical protein ACRRTK_008195 [Alexandromys fortis]
MICFQHFPFYLVSLYPFEQLDRAWGSSGLCIWSEPPSGCSLGAVGSLGS